MSKFLVTGVAGFIGSEVASQLLDMNHEVLGIDSFNTLLYDNLNKEKRIQRICNRNNFSLLKGNIMNIDLDHVLNGVDHVVNEAGLPGQLNSWQHIEEYFESNTFAAGKLFEAALRNNVKSFIQASTSSVYGSNAVGKEDQKLNPSSPYGISKLAAEHLINLLNTGTNIRTVILRYFSVYGPGQRPDMGIFKFIESIKKGLPVKVYGDGKQSRDFTYVGDVARATISAIEQGAAGETYNISGGQQISVIELLKTLEELMNLPVKIEYVAKPKGDQQLTFADTTKSKKDLSWIPKVTFKQGLAEQVKWHLNVK